MTNGNEYQLGRGAEGVDRCLMTNVFNSDYSFLLPPLKPFRKRNKYKQNM